VADARLTLTCELPESEIYVEADASRIQQVLLNLLNNAIRYTPENGRIGVTLTRAGADARLIVADTGIGIAPEALPRIFEMFRQEGEGGDRKGLGIGLALVESLVTLHGGRVWAESEGLGRGSRFIVELPALRPSAASGAGLAPGGDGDDFRFRPRGPSAGEGATILVVEDSPDGRESLCEGLELLGYHVHAVGSAEEALVLLAEEHPDVLVSDIGLPGMDGFALMRRVRQMAEQAGVAAVAVTGYAATASAEQARAAGFDAYLVKPFDLDALDRELRALLGRRARAGAG
jgi:CheY-like chemotaxis protein